MAKTRTRATSRPSSRATKSRKPAATAEVEVVEEEDGGNIDTGIVMFTTLMLVAAFLMVDKLRGLYDEGLFF